MFVKEKKKGRRKELTRRTFSGNRKGILRAKILGAVVIRLLEKVSEEAGRLLGRPLGPSSCSLHLLQIKDFWAG